MSTAGYSQTPLAKKLGIKPGYRIMLINQPGHYFQLFTDMPEITVVSNGEKVRIDFIHFFTKDSNELHNILPSLKDQITPQGIIWVSWPKKSSKVPTTVDENTIRNLALKIGLVDIKVCAIDDTWSGLKLVIPVKDRKPA